MDLRKVCKPPFTIPSFLQARCSTLYLLVWFLDTRLKTYCSWSFRITSGSAYGCQEIDTDLAFLAFGKCDSFTGGKGDFALLFKYMHKGAPMATKKKKIATEAAEAPMEPVIEYGTTEAEYQEPVVPEGDWREGFEKEYGWIAPNNVIGFYRAILQELYRMRVGK